ncbi:MAG: hypothetical protein RLZZ292_800 [Bacteroidota bacterium]|jgi:hypothetical protein
MSSFSLENAKIARNEAALKYYLKSDNYTV